MTILEARNLSPGDYIHLPDRHNADGTPMRARITSVKTWKRDPNRIEVRVKRGLSEYATFHADELDQIQPGYGS